MKGRFSDGRFAGNGLENQKGIRLLMIMSGMNRRNDVWCVGRDGKRKVMKWDYGLEMVELIVKWIKMVRELILDWFDDGWFNCCFFSLLAWNIKKEW